VSTYGPNGVIVVYSVTDSGSFLLAGEVLRWLWQEGVTQEKAVILVGNKCDLERARVVSSQEGKALASSYESKFIETSVGIGHNVDELLVGTLKQCRLRGGRNKPKGNKEDDESKEARKRKKKKKRKRRAAQLALFSIHDLARELLGKLINNSSVSMDTRNKYIIGGNGGGGNSVHRYYRSRSCENLHVL
jgi:GTPase SAR1 family protein